jgi:hypothetical protein
MGRMLEPPPKMRKGGNVDSKMEGICFMVVKDIKSLLRAEI